MTMLKVSEAAACLEISGHQVRNWTKLYDLRTYRAENGYHYYDAETIEILKHIKIWSQEHGLRSKEIKARLYAPDEKKIKAISHTELIRIVENQQLTIESMQREITRLHDRFTEYVMKSRQEQRQNSVTNKVKSVIDKLKNN